MFPVQGFALSQPLTASSPSVQFPSVLRLLHHSPFGFHFRIPYPCGHLPTFSYCLSPSLVSGLLPLPLPDQLTTDNLQVCLKASSSLLQTQPFSSSSSGVSLSTSYLRCRKFCWFMWDLSLHKVMESLMLHLAPFSLCLLSLTGDILGEDVWPRNYGSRIGRLLGGIAQETGKIAPADCICFSWPLFVQRLKE